MLRRKSKKYWPVLVALVTLAFCLPANADVVEDLRKQLAEKRKAVDEIEQEIKEFQADIAQKQSEATTLAGQIKVIDSSTKSLSLQIDKTNAEIEKIEIETKELENELQLVQEQIDKQKLLLAEYIKTLQTLDDLSAVEAFFKYSTLSEAITEIRTVYRAEQNSQVTLSKIRELQNTLKDRRQTYNDFKRELDGLRTRQVGQKKTLQEQQQAKSRLLEITKAQETEFKKLLAKSAAEEKAANAEIARLDAAIRAELEKQGYKKLGALGQLDWPVEPIFGVSCGFHCAGYPFASLIGPHTGTDIPTDMGTPIKAPSDGYVAKVSIAAGTGYSYILVIHGEGISTVYGHVSNASVNEGSYVTRGQVIGHTGGAPGTRGAGLSTGPHLHFEVRKNGIPVNAENYLPPL